MTETIGDVCRLLQIPPRRAVNWVFHIFSALAEFEPAMIREHITVEAVAARLGVAPATLYRYLPGGRGGLDALGE